MAPRRRAGRNPSGVNRNMLNQRQKLTSQRLPIYQGPSPAPVQGPGLRIPGGLMGTRQPVSRPAPQVVDIWNPKPKAAAAATAASTVKPSLMSTLGIPALAGGALALLTEGLFPRPAGRGSTLKGTSMDPYKLAEESNKRIAAEKTSTPGKTALSAAAKSFDSAFAKARAAGLSEFSWRGKSYNTRYAGE
jgi:hypothetical protein